MTRIRLKVQGTEMHITATDEADATFLPLKQLAALVGMETVVDCKDRNIYTVEVKKTTQSGSWWGLDEALRNRLRVNMAKYREDLARINNRIFNKPEMGNEEYAAAEMIVDFLQSLGLSVEKGLSGIHPQSGRQIMIDTAFKASAASAKQGPVITIMLEYDALPMGHACGHNLIAVSGLAALCALLPLMDSLGGKLQVIGTPAEEGGHLGGKIPLLAGGHFSDSDIVLITHPGDRWDTGADFLAISGGRFTFTGVPSHASAAPEKGVSALDAAIMAYTGIETLREHVRADARIHGIIKEGGEAANIVPARASLSYAVRALDQPYVDELKKKIEECVHAGAKATGASAEIHWSFGYSAPINVATLDNLVRDMVISEMIPGISKWEALGSSDLGNIGFEIPTCNLWFQIAPEGILPHTHEFMKAAGSESGYEAALQAGYVMAMAATVLFKDESLVKSIQTEFHAQKGKLLQNDQ